MCAFRAGIFAGLRLYYVRRIGTSVFPQSISENYYDIAAESTQYLEQLLQIENPCGFRMKILVAVRRMFEYDFSKNGNIKFLSAAPEGLKTACTLCEYASAEPC
jgi:hypothetical protein